ncbi:MAG: VWA domain-containing protein, partial [Anaerolineales bacterium]|nr:VWA domain-containing protein [Anaerolineales bacterium]
RVEHIELLRTVFDAYWGYRELEPNIYEQGQGGPEGINFPSVEQGQESSLLAMVGEDPEEDEANGEVRQSYSAVEALRQKDFSQIDEQERQALRWMIAELNPELGRRRSRRWRLGRGQRVDLRRSLRANLRHGGEWVTWIRRGPRSEPRPLVILADISGSMEVYTRVLLQFVYGLVQGSEARTEVFVFGTRLTRITRYLQEANPERALDKVTQEVPDWSGGTRIGRALRTFNVNWAHRALGKGAVVLLVSDGWDRGEPELLRQEMARLQRSCHRMIWLNPLLGSEDYEPLTRGMQAALPHVDDFLPVHNFASLKDLAEHLQGLDHRDGRHKLAARVGRAQVGG